jgi:hypothetical protein
MPTWSGILKELQDSSAGDRPPDLDGVRRKYLVALNQHTQRNVILYATKWTQAGSPDIPNVGIVDEDLQGIMEVIQGLSGPNLDLILHSPGGSLAAAESLVTYLRSKFSNIRVVVPQLAMSAATMIACAADSIVLGKHSFLGPIDPQVIVNTKLGQRMIPAQAILDQFEQAKKECQDPRKLGAWLPMLEQYGPDLLVQCQNASRLSKELVKGWLARYMFKGERGGAAKAARVARWLADHRTWKSHNRHIPRELLESKGLKIEYLEEDQTAQDLFLSVFHATTHCFNMVPVVKIIENHLGKAFIQHAFAQPMWLSPPPTSQPPSAPPETPMPAAPPAATQSDEEPLDPPRPV